jgi:hypothetical protein
MHQICFISIGVRLIMNICIYKHSVQIDLEHLYQINLLRVKSYSFSVHLGFQSQCR